MVIVADIGQHALDNLNYHSIEVRTGQAGTLVDVLVDAGLVGQLPRTRAG